MKMSIAVLGSPYASQSAHTALNFTKAALIAGHDVIRVFFYHEAAYVGNGFNTPPQDEFALTQQWSDFAIEHDLELIVCVASALRRVQVVVVRRIEPVQITSSRRIKPVPKKSFADICI